MAKGYYYPELLAIHTYSQNPGETLAYLQAYTAALRDAFSTLQAGKSAETIRLDNQGCDLDRAIAFGSLIHEYTHHLQYTTRNMGLFFYECRHQQSVWTYRCLKEMREGGVPPLIPLMKYVVSPDTTNPILERWRDQWVAYEGGIALTGLGAWLAVQGAFPQEMPREFFAAMGVNRSTDDLRWTHMLEAEAEIITGEILRETFPSIHTEARNALGESEETLAFRENGIHRLIPILCDYCMQSHLVVDKRPMNPRTLFDTAVAAVEQLFAGIDYADIMKHIDEIIGTMQQATGLPPLPELLRTAEDQFTKLATIAYTPLGALLRQGIQYRRARARWFATLPAFFVVIMHDFPVPIWHYFNSNHYADCPNQGTFFGHLADEVLPVLFQRLCLWGAREIAVRPGQVVCPECRLNAMLDSCTGSCGFVNTCRDQFGIDPFKREWSGKEEKSHASAIPI